MNESKWPKKKERTILSEYYIIRFQEGYNSAIDDCIAAYNEAQGNTRDWEKKYVKDITRTFNLTLPPHVMGQIVPYHINFIKKNVLKSPMAVEGWENLMLIEFAREFGDKALTREYKEIVYWHIDFIKKHVLKDTVA